MLLAEAPRADELMRAGLSAEIDAVEESGEPRRLVTVLAPRSGVVLNRGVTVGTSVDPSTTLLTIADLTRVFREEIAEGYDTATAVRRTLALSGSGANSACQAWRKVRP